MRAQHVWRAVITLRAVRIECVHFGAGGVVAGDVERVEVIPIRFDLRAFGNRETHVGENGGDFLSDLGNRVDRALAAWARWQGHIKPLTAQALVQCGVIKGHLFGDECRINLVFQGV